MTDYVIFKEVPFGNGRVETGWRFKDNQQESPSEQFCHYIEALDDTREGLVILGFDGKFRQPQTPPQNLDVKAAFSNCVWKDAAH